MQLVNYLLVFALAVVGTNSQTARYNAAVVEYSPINGGSAINANEYVKIIAEQINKTSEEIDLIIFPEMTLNGGERNVNVTYLPSGNNSNEIVCNSTNTQYSEVLKTLACAAMEYKVNLVINLLVQEKNCTDANCTSIEEVLYFNTNVVLGTNGTVIATYKKYNLFGESGVSHPKRADVVTFQIKNVTFGMFICFDIMFSEPALNLTRNENVKNIIFPTMWFGELPFLTGLQAQQMWAHENDVVLLAAGANNAQVGSGGSGIFVGSDGPLEMVTNTENSTVVYGVVPNLEVANTSETRNISAIYDTEESIDALGKSMDDFFLLIDPSIKDYNSVILNTTATGNNSATQQVCHGTNPVICCQFDLVYLVNNATQVIPVRNNTYVYHLVAFNGVRTFGGFRDGGIESCAIVACLNSSVSSCGMRFANYSRISWPITFTNISISGNFTNDDKRIQFPETLLASIRPIHPHFVNWQKEINNNSVTRTLSMDLGQSRLLTFGIYGRDFSRDSEPGDHTDNNKDDGNSGQTLKLHTLLAVVVAFLLIFIEF